MVSKTNYIEDEEDEMVTRLEDFEPPVQLDKSFTNFVIVDRIPSDVPESKHAKLKEILTKAFSMDNKYKCTIHLPITDDKKTKGYCFFEYETKEGAIKAYETLNNYKLDTNHRFKVNLFDDHRKLMNYSETYTRPKTEEFVPKQNYNGYMQSKLSLDGYDQFVLRYGDFTEVCWNEMEMNKPKSEIAQSGWTSSYVQWSNSGSYLVTFHPDRIVLFGGDNWGQLAEFKHKGVQLIDFSPEDKYLVTFAPVLNDDKNDPKSIIVWDIRSGKKLRGFVSPPKEQFSWPAFQWSAKDQFFARQFEDKGINIYEAPACNLLGGSTLAIPRILDFSWSPSDPCLAYFVPCTDTLPGKISVIGIPDKKLLAEKSAWEAIGARFHWQNVGDYLCVKVDRRPSKKNQPVAVTTSFELFRMHQPNIPIENFEVPSIVKAFAWEPRGKRICVIHGEVRHDMNVTFLEVAKSKVTTLTKLEHRKLNTIFWSPRGSYILLAMVGDTGELEFFNCNSLETMSTQEHLQCTGVDWNPSGRYVATYVSHWKVQTDTGYKIWSFAGEPVYSVLRDRFFQFVWRPRPPLAISAEKMKEIKGSLDKYSAKFKEEDESVLRAKIEIENQRLKQLMTDFLGLLQAGERDYQALAPEREKKNIHEEIDPRDEYSAYEKVEELIDVTSKVIKK